jgi:hypothetical protein
MNEAKGVGKTGFTPKVIRRGEGRMLKMWLGECCSRTTFAAMPNPGLCRIKPRDVHTVLIRSMNWVDQFDIVQVVKVASKGQQLIIGGLIASWFGVDRRGL